MMVTAVSSFSHQPGQRSKFSKAWRDEAWSLDLQMSGVVIKQPQRW